MVAELHAYIGMTLTRPPSGQPNPPGRTAVAAGTGGRWRCPARTAKLTAMRPSLSLQWWRRP